MTNEDDDVEVRPEDIHIIHPGREGRVGPTVAWKCPACGNSTHQADPVKDGGEWLTCSNAECGRAVHVMVGKDGKDFQVHLEWPEDEDAE